MGIPIANDILNSLFENILGHQQIFFILQDLEKFRKNTDKRSWS